MKFSIGQPIQEKDTKWKGYIMWYFEEINEYLISCYGYSTPSHWARYPEDALEGRKMVKREISIQQNFRRHMEKLWANRDSFVRKHSCKGCKMVNKPVDNIPWRMGGTPCPVGGLRWAWVDLYPFRKSRCLLRCETPRQAMQLREKYRIKKATKKENV